MIVRFLMTTSLVFYCTIALASEPCQTKGSPLWPSLGVMPVGENFLHETKLETAGIEIGTDFATACTALRKHTDSILNVSMFSAAIRVDGAQAALEYPGQIETTKDFFEDQSSDLKRETFFLQFSAPATGSQLFRINRSLLYSLQGRQPLISDFLVDLRNKYGNDVSKKELPNGVLYTWVFDSGHQTEPGRQEEWCLDSPPITPGDADKVNQKKNCDIHVSLYIEYGAVKEVAKIVTINIFDLERYKDNTLKDYDALAQYQRSLADDGVIAPKL